MLRTPHEWSSMCLWVASIAWDCLSYILNAQITIMAKPVQTYVAALWCNTTWVSQSIMGSNNWLDPRLNHISWGLRQHGQFGIPGSGQRQRARFTLSANLNIFGTIHCNASYTVPNNKTARRHNYMVIVILEHGMVKKHPGLNGTCSRLPSQRAKMQLANSKRLRLMYLSQQTSLRQFAVTKTQVVKTQLTPHHVSIYELWWQISLHQGSSEARFFWHLKSFWYGWQLEFHIWNMGQEVGSKPIPSRRLILF